MDEGQRLAASVKNRAGQRYRRELREQLVAYAKVGRGRGLSWEKLGAELGVKPKTLRRWFAELPRATKRRTNGSKPSSNGKPGRLVSVRAVQAAAQPVVAVASVGSVALVSPGGWRVEGLSVAEAAGLLREVTG